MKERINKMRVKDIKNEELRKRVEVEKSHVALPNEAFAPGSPVVQFMNTMGLPENDGLIMIPRETTIQIDASIEDAGSVALPTMVVETMIKEASHRAIANFCICRDGMECKDYPIDWGCIFLGDAVTKIDPELARQTTVEETLEYAEKCRSTGLVQMIGKFSFDLRWLNPEVGPAENLVTICNCCPCCCGMRTIRGIKDELREQQLARMPGVEIEITNDCAGCGLCVEQCMFTGINLVNDKAVINEKCRICGRCVDVCPSQAIKITLKSKTAVNDAIKDITSRVNHR
jgi:ferredoxin